MRPPAGILSAMNTRRTWYPTKRAWAEAKVAELAAEESRLRARHIPEWDWRGVQGKMRALEAVARDRRRFELLTERFRAEAA